MGRNKRFENGITLYYHQTNGGAEYLTDSNEGRFSDATIIIRLDGKPEVTIRTETDNNTDETALYRVKVGNPASERKEIIVDGYLAWHGVIQEYELKYARNKAKLFNGKIERVQP